MFKVRTLELVLNMDYLTCFLILMGVKSLFQVSIVLSVFESAGLIVLMHKVKSLKSHHSSDLCINGNL